MSGPDERQRHPGRSGHVPVRGPRHVVHSDNHDTGVVGHVPGRPSEHPTVMVVRPFRDAIKVVTSFGYI